MIPRLRRHFAGGPARRDDGVARGVEGHGTDGRPVAGVAGAALRVALASLSVQLVASCEHCGGVAGMTPRRAHAADAAVTMLVVVPAREASGAGTRQAEVGEALGRQLGAVLRGAPQALCAGSVRRRWSKQFIAILPSPCEATCSR